MKQTKNLIIGAGPAGLAVAGRMRHRNIPFELLEQTTRVGWAWRHHYDRLHLHTVKQLSALPHLPFPDHYPVYVPRQQVVDYLENYAQHFNIQPQFNTAVQQIKKEKNQWIVQTNTDQTYVADNVVIATGVNRIPNVPVWEGQDTYKGSIIHSRNYKNPKPFKGQKVLVVGMGNTGAEVALDLSEHNIDTTISVRSPITMVPRDVNGRPVQLTAKKLAKIPFGIGDWLGTQIRRFIIGDLTKYGVPLSTMHPTVQLRETGKTPVIDIGTAQAIKDGKIKAVGGIDRLYEEGVLFKNGDKKAFDSIILATGYHAKLADFIEGISGSLDKYQLPTNPIGADPFKQLYFVGFDNYKLGGLLGTIQTDSKTIVDTIEQQ